MKISIKHIIGAIILSIILTSCSVVPITGRRKLNMGSDTELLSASQQQYRGFVSKARVGGKLVNNQQVNRVSRALISATNSYLKQKGYTSILRNLRWEVNVVKSPQVNAFCMPGGKIVVYTGLLRLIGNGRNADAELSAVLGHEIGHALASHAGERMRNKMLMNMGGQILGSAVGAKSAALQNVVGMAYGLGGKVFVTLPFGRKQELEADKIGLVLMALAGYDPHNAVTLWQKMARKSGGKKRNEFLSTHPSEAKRIRKIQKALPEAMKYYKGGRTTSRSKGMRTMHISSKKKR